MKSKLIEKIYEQISALNDTEFDALIDYLKKQTANILSISAVVQAAKNGK